MLVSLRNARSKVANADQSMKATRALVVVTTLFVTAGFASRTNAHDPQVTAQENEANSPAATAAYSAAAKLQNERKFKPAAIGWETFLKEHADDPLATDAQHYLGVCRLQTKDLKGATVAMQASLAGDKECECREDTYIDLGWIYFLRGIGGESGQMEQSASILEEYALAYPNGEWVDQATFYRAEALVHQGKLADAVQAYQRVIDKFPETSFRAQSLFALASSQHDLKRTDQAAKLYRQFTVEFPQHEMLPDVAFRYGQLSSEQGDYAKAATMFGLAGADTEFLARDQALFQAGYCHSTAGDFAAAAADYALIADSCSESPLVAQANLDAGRCFAEAKDYGNALVRLEHSLESTDNDIVLQAHHWLSRVDLFQDRYETAGKEAQRGLKWIEENAPETHQMRLPLLLDYAESLEGMVDKKPAALATFISLADEYPKSNVAPRALYRAIRLAIQIDDKDQADALTNRFTSTYPEHPLAKDVQSLSVDVSLAKGEPAVAESRLKSLMTKDDPQSQTTPVPNLPLAPLTKSSPENISPEKTAAPQASVLEGQDPTTGDSPHNPLTLDSTVRANSTTDPTDSQQSLEEMASQLLPTQIPFESPAPINAPTETTTETDLSTNATITDADSPNALKFKLARSLFLQKKYEECIDTLTPILNATEPTPQHPSHAIAYYFLGTSQLHLEQYENSFKSLSSALLCDPNGEHAPQVCNRMAQALVKLGRTDDARKVLTRVVLVFKDHKHREQSLLQLAELEYLAGNNEAGLLRYREMLQQYPESRWSARAAFGVARVAVRQGTPDRALKLLDRLLTQKLSPELRHEILMLRAATLQKRGDHAACLKDLETLLAEQPSGDARSDALLLAAPSHLADRHPGLARQCLESVLQDNPTYPHIDQVLYQLAWIAKRNGDKATETRRFGALAATLPKSPLAVEANYHLGEDAFTKNRINEALPYFAVAAKSSRNLELMEKSVHRLAWCYFHQREYADAESVLRVQLERFPDGRTAQVARFLIAECMFLQSDFAAAHQQFLEVSDGVGLSAKQEALVYLHGGQAAGKLKNWKDAERWLAQIHRKFSDSEYAPVAYWELAQVFRAQDRLDEAETAMRRTAQAGKGELSARAQFELAQLARTRGRKGQAYREFQVLMYGYGGNLATAEVKTWQVKAALQAADCAAEKAQDAFRSEEEKYLRQAEKCLTFVLDTRPGSEEAETATRRMANLVDKFDFEPLIR